MQEEHQHLLFIVNSLFHRATSHKNLKQLFMIHIFHLVFQYFTKSERVVTIGVARFLLISVALVQINFIQGIRTVFQHYHEQIICLRNLGVYDLVRFVWNLDVMQYIWVVGFNDHQTITLQPLKADVGPLCTEAIQHRSVFKSAENGVDQVFLFRFIIELKHDHPMVVAKIVLQQNSHLLELIVVVVAQI